MKRSDWGMKVTYTSPPTPFQGLNFSFSCQLLLIVQPASGLKAPPTFRVPPIASLHWGLFILKAYGLPFLCSLFSILNS
ncbi:MAG: hypothetical protein LBG15_12325 [Dysgonamonadaceae bacterium]|nr:hypothetical protein [Dysgonamonadaceae bacterium]